MGSNVSVAWGFPGWGGEGANFQWTRSTGVGCGLSIASSLPLIAYHLDWLFFTGFDSSTCWRDRDWLIAGVLDLELALECSAVHHVHLS